MRIAIVTSRLDFGGGGVAQVVWGLSKELSAKGHTICLFGEVEAPDFEQDINVTGVYVKAYKSPSLGNIG